jgi:ADP-heptose:LPS heptosyltransferase
VQIRLRQRVSLLYHNAGYGDTLLVGAVAREIKKAYGPVKITVNGIKEELLRSNPSIDATGQRFDGIDLNYHYGKPRHSGEGFTENLLDIMCARVGIKNPVHTVDFFFNQNELIYADEVLKNCCRPIITIQTASGPLGNGRKSWPVHHWKLLVGRLRESGCTVIHLGGNHDIPLPETVDRLGKQDIRRSIAILKCADVHIGVVSSLMHAAEAVKTPAVILFGGFERYSAHGYASIHPIESAIDCSPCAQPNTVMDVCPKNNRCMEEILPGTVFDKVRDILMAKGYDIRAIKA